MAIVQPDLTGTDVDVGPIGVRNGVPGGAKTVTQIATSAAKPSAPQKVVQATYAPGSFLDFHMQLEANPAQASRALDQAIRFAYDNTATLQAMMACRQSGSALVTGSIKNIPTGLSQVAQVQGSIDNGATAHNFWVSVVKGSTPGAVDIYVWQPTAAGNNTPIACTTPVTVRWIADGSL